MSHEPENTASAIATTMATKMATASSATLVMEIISQFVYKFLIISLVFQCSGKFFEVFRPVWTSLDLFGYVRMRLDASGCVWVRLEIFKKIDPKRSENGPDWSGNSKKMGGYR